MKKPSPPNTQEAVDVAVKALGDELADKASSFDGVTGVFPEIEQGKVSQEDVEKMAKAALEALAKQEMEAKLMAIPADEIATGVREITVVK